MSGLMDSAIRRAEMLKEWEKWAHEIANAVKELISEAEVYVIGSVARGDYVAGSDVDVLVISRRVPEKLSERGRIKVLIEERLNLPYYHPFEIHLVRPEEVESYLRRTGRYAIKIT